jgi:hypothetical protein
LPPAPTVPAPWPACRRGVPLGGWFASGREARSIPLVGRERRRSAALSHPGFRIGSVSPLSFFRTRRAKRPKPLAPPGVSLRRLQGEPRLRFPGALRTLRPKPSRLQASVDPAASRILSGAGRSHQASLLPCRAGLGGKPKPPLPLPLRKAQAFRKGRSLRVCRPFSGTFQRSRSLRPSPVRLLPSEAEASSDRCLPHLLRGRFPVASEGSQLEQLRGAPFPAGRFVWMSCPLQLALPHARLPPCRPLPPLPAAPPSRGMKLLRLRRPVAFSGFASFPPRHPSGYRNDAVSKTESRKA